MSLKISVLDLLAKNIFPANFVYLKEQGDLLPNLLFFSILFSHFVLFFAKRC